MSIEALTIALHHSRATGATKIVLLGIANHDGDGGSWPSVATLARYAGVDARSVQRSIKRLEQLHEIKRHVQAGGTAWTADHQRPNRYDFLLRCPVDCDRSSQHRTREYVPVELDVDPLTPASPGDAGVTRPLTPASPEPSSNHPSNKSQKKGRLSDAGACGHARIDERHCERGCAPARVEGSAA